MAPKTKKARQKPSQRRRKALQRKRSRMTDKPQPWPRLSRQIRDRVAHENQANLNDLEGAEELTDNPTLLKKLKRITGRSGTMARLLESMGATSRPR